MPRLEILVFACAIAAVGCEKDSTKSAEAQKPAAARPAPAPAVPGPLQWRTDLAGAVAEAKSTDRVVFVEFSAEWCAPCKEIEEKVFSVDRVRAELAKFVLVKLDVTTGDTVASDIADKYEANSLPYLMVLDPHTDKVLGHIGTMTTPDELIAMLAATH